MQFTDIQFDILTYIERYQEEHLTIEQLSTRTHYACEEIIATIQTLKDLELLDEHNLPTLKAYRVLEPYKVKKAIFMAAGFGSRMVPLTLSMPKPLIMVNGKRIIETLLDAVLKAGIEDIYIVRGYQANVFDMLLTKYPMIKFIENPTYNEANNIGTAMKFKEIMAKAYILESDLVLSNPDIIRKYELHSNYMGKYVDYTNDWCFDVKDGVIQAVNSEGGHDCFHMYGVSFWKEEDALKLASDIPAVYESEGGKQKYFEEVPLRAKKDNYTIHVRPVFEGDIIEIDTFAELQEVDSSYK